ncbi:hypothetical protein C8R43DRAFT_887983, partial [Mycena crocata]
YKSDSGQSDTKIFKGYAAALRLTFSQSYGDAADSLSNWQGLCRTIEIPVPDTLLECKHAIEDAHVNIMDLLDVHTTGKPVHRLKTELELSTYTMSTKRIFPREEVLATRGPFAHDLQTRGGESHAA